jgi:hypothetical protein
LNAAFAALAAAGLAALLCWMQPKRPIIPAILMALACEGWLLLAGLEEARALFLFLTAVAAGAAWSLPGEKFPSAGGAWIGLLLSLLGGGAWLTRPLLQALSPLSLLAGFIDAMLPFALLCVAVFAVFCAVQEEDGKLRRRGPAAALAVFLGGPWLLEAYLSGSWDYGAGSLKEAAGLPVAGSSASSTVVVLKPEGGEEFQIQERLHAVGRLDASRETLLRARRYLDERGWRSLYKKEGLLLLRRGWLDHWEPELALEALSLHVPGEAVPDYAAALALIRAGPLNEERLARLKSLDELARTVKGGFESVSSSQKIFEAFSSAYARYGDEERSRSWLLRVDKLWPLYDKKIEVAPLERMRDGSIQGSLFIDGRPASAVKVGLFLETLSEATGRRTVDFSGAVWPDSSGLFRFDDLGPGTYHLELLGTPEQLRGTVLGSPGFIDLYEGSRRVVLPPIMIERRALPSPVDGARRVLPGMRAPLR